MRYKLNDETNLFANYAKGNQPTQGYATFFQLTPAQQTVASANGVNPSAPEAEVENYELGIKHREDDGRWYLNASIYYLEWVGRQGVRTMQVDLNGDGRSPTCRRPRARTSTPCRSRRATATRKGVELDGALKLAEHWTIGGSGAYADTEITKALNETVPLRFLGVTDAKGFDFPLVPKFSGFRLWPI